MSRHTVRPPFQPKHIADFPCGTCDEAGHLVETLSSWRTSTPEVNLQLCTGCLRCYLLCPEGMIVKKNGKVAIEFDFCKGCGICAHECRSDAIRMIARRE
jgi:pyruvate ferredoxin oxidoreductase delta subunit